MYYKNDSIGIRERGAGGKQVFSFGAGTGLGEEKLRNWADDVLKRLDEGTSVQDAKAWIDERLS